MLGLSTDLFLRSVQCSPRDYQTDRDRADGWQYRARRGELGIAAADGTPRALLQVSLIALF